VRVTAILWASLLPPSCSSISSGSIQPGCLASTSLISGSTSPGYLWLGFVELCMILPLFLLVLFYPWLVFWTFSSAMEVNVVERI
jgi:hypothetical protein